ncbi:Hypothetical protein FKW44_000015, partial [Caligus rogercresseyi]
EVYLNAFGAIFYMIVGAITLTDTPITLADPMTLASPLVLLADFLTGIKKANIALAQNSGDEES